MKAPGEWPAPPEFDCDTCCGMGTLYYVDRSEPCYECQDFVASSGDRKIGNDYTRDTSIPERPSCFTSDGLAERVFDNLTAGDPLTPTSDRLSDRYHIVESLINLRNELDNSKDCTELAIMYKINSCLFDQYPMQRDELSFEDTGGHKWADQL